MNMPKGRGRKNAELPPLVDNLKQSYEVQKSTPLFSLWKSELSLSEFKILDTYLSRINSHNPEQRCVRFEKGEMERLLGVKQLKPTELKIRLRHLMEQVVELKDPRKNRGFALISLFSMAYCEKDENEQWQIDLSCTQEAMEYFFNIEEIGYLRYKLRSIININSRYSYILFTYLENNRFRKEWTVDLIELKQILNCENDESYNEFKIFNNRILKNCHRELTEKTDLSYTYEPIKTGRRVTAVKFTLSTLSDIVPKLQEPVQLSFNFENSSSSFNDNIEFLSDACEGAFSYEEIELIFNLISTMELPSHKDGIQFARFHYLLEKYTLLKVEAKKHNIKNKFNYFKAMIENDRRKEDKNG